MVRRYRHQPVADDEQRRGTQVPAIGQRANPRGGGCADQGADRRGSGRDVHLHALPAGDQVELDRPPSRIVCQQGDAALSECLSSGQEEILVPKILDGIRVFDLTIAAVGQWATKLLGALGADVIKVEAPGGDRLSHAVPPMIKGSSVLYISANHNKRMIELDLKKEADRAIALKIIEKSDVFVQNMRPGAVERLGLGYEVVTKVNPRMIYVAASAYGRTGPMAGEAGIDPTVQSFCGWCRITGSDHGRGEMYRHLAHLDLTTATTITQAVLQALIARERTGQGQRIEIEMLTAAMALQTTRLAEYFATGEQPAPLGSAAATTAPHQAFECEDQRYIAIGVERDEQWPGFCRALKLDELISDQRFATNPQ